MFKFLKISAWLPEQRIDGGILALLVLLYLVPALWTIGDYGVMYDASELYVGDRNLAFYRTLDPEYLRYEIPKPMPLYEAEGHSDFQRICIHSPTSPATTRPHHIWPLGGLSSSITKHVFFGLGILPAIDAQHVAPMLWFSLLLVVTYWFARKHFGRVAAIFATLALLSHPRLVAHSHNNIKDIPEMALFAATIFLVHDAIRRRSWRRILLGAVVWGFAVATKGNALFLPVILLPWFGFLLARHWKTHEELFRWKQLAAMLSFPFAALAVSALCWPLLFMDFPVQFNRHVEYITARGFTQGDGTLNVANIIHLFTTTPAQVLFVAVIGAVVLFRKKGDFVEKAVLLLLWILVTVARVTAPGTNDHDVIRHWIEFLVPVALFCGVGCSYLVSLASTHLRTPKPLRSQRVAATALALLLFSGPVAWMIRNHPFQLVYYNALIGGLPGAKKCNLPASTDYWSNSYASGMKWLNANAEKGAVLVSFGSPDVIAFTAAARLRPDIRFLPTNEWEPKRTGQELLDLDGVVYFIYVTREERYEPLLKVIDERCSPIHQIMVEETPILKIIRIEKQRGPIQLPDSKGISDSKGIPDSKGMGAPGLTRC